MALSVSFELPDDNEQREMVEYSASRYLEDRYSFEERRKLVDTELGYCQEQWQEMVELGWMYIAISEEFDGLGDDAGLAATLMKEFGRMNFQSPFFVSAILSAKIIENLADDSVRFHMLDQIAEGLAIVSAALYEPQSRFDLNNVATAAIKKGDGYVLNGTKVGVLYGSVAKHLLVLARTSGDQSDKDGLSIFLLASDQEGISLENHRTHDGCRMSTLTLEDVTVERESLIGPENLVLPELQNSLNFAISMLCAEMVGVMEATFEQTLEYVKMRSQFGKSVGSFQSIQHRLVDMYMRCELSASMSAEAARAVNELTGKEQDRLVAAAKSEIGRAAILNGEEAIQLHGAMGMMDEIPIGHYLKRVFALNSLLGDAEFHQSRYRELSDGQ